MAMGSGDDRPPRYVEVTEDGEEVVIYRASGIGGCTRALVAQGSRYTPSPHPAWFQEILNEGNQYEDEILRMFGEQRGGEVGDRQKQVELYVGEIEGRKVYLRGRIDGTFVGVPVDAKKVRLGQWLDFQQRGVEYVGGWPWQIATYMYALGAEEFMLIGGCLDTDKREIVDTHVEVVSNPPVPLRAIKAKIAKVEALIAEEDVNVACDVKQYPCPFFYLHDVDAEEPPTRISDAVMIEAAEKFRYVQMTMDVHTKQLKELEKEKRRLSEEMREWLRKNGMGERDRLEIGEGAGKVEVKRVRYPRKEYVVKASTVDYFSVKRPQTTPKPVEAASLMSTSKGSSPDGSEDGGEDTQKDSPTRTRSEMQTDSLGLSKKVVGKPMPKPRPKTERNE